MVLSACANIQEEGPVYPKAMRWEREEGALEKVQKSQYNWDRGVPELEVVVGDQTARGLARTSRVKPLSRVSMLHILWLWVPLSFLEPLFTLALEPSWDQATEGDAEEEASSPAQTCVFIMKHEY